MNHSTTQKRGSLQVVKVSQNPEHRYELDEEALVSVLLRPDVRNLPVVIISVTGNYRGGKSFILDFFLRYLKAPVESRSTSEWLDRDEIDLEGFEWRGGGESNTKGIHLWPEPIIVTTEPTGEKVAVLLMDTQGTFDMESDMRENSTIFALSTLLSSVQIYNLRANIGEDDLQHLQLFTEYGRLACNTEGKAFQTLLFLVRDWMSAYEYPYGYTGGKALMDKRLAPKPNQKKQLREVRNHFYSCFEKLQCFLMPHPGLIVADEQFRGQICDIDEEFRLSLLELVPSLLNPNNLTPKTIDGGKVRTQELLDLFRKYVEIFNSDEMPEAITIFQATAEACMMSVLRESREWYESKMESYIVEDQTASTSVIYNWHNDAVVAATAYFQEKKKLGSSNSIAAHQAELQKFKRLKLSNRIPLKVREKFVENKLTVKDFLQELEARLALYLWQNDAKVRNTLSEAKKVYEDAVGVVCQDQASLCLHANDLQALHFKALRAALAVFDNTRTRVPQETDTERTSLIENLEKYYKHLCAVNEQNNKIAMLEARELYLSQMKDDIHQQGASSEELIQQHEDALKNAITHFQSLRNQLTQETEDPDLKRLKEDIESYFEDFKKANVHSNLLALQVAEHTYNHCVSSVWGAQSHCFHPQALKDLHDDAESQALLQFLGGRDVSKQDDYKDKLIAILKSRYSELQEINDFNNNQAVEQAYIQYMQRMDECNQPGLGRFSGRQLIMHFIVKLFALLPMYHEKAKDKALSIFKKKRLGRTYDDDEYLNNLTKKIDDAFTDYQNPLNAVIREIGL